MLHRDVQGARLTRGGEVLVARGAQLVGELGRLLGDARDAATDAQGLVRVLIPLGMPPEMVAGMTANVQAAGLDIRIALDEWPDPAGAHLSDAELVFHLGPAPDQADWFSRVVRRAPVRLVASLGYLETHGTPESVADLASHRLLTWTGANAPADRLPLRAGGQQQVVPWFSSANIALLRRLAGDGLGIALAPDGGVPDEAGTEPLVPVLDGIVGRDEALRASSPLPSRSDPRVRAFVERLHALLRAFPDV